jgi:hypothetical protein
MKPFRLTMMLLVTCLLQSCQDVAFQSVEMDVDKHRKAGKQVRSPNEKLAFTMTAIANSDNRNHFLVWVGGEPGTINVDWGDGTSTTHDLGELYSSALEKVYESPGRYDISITGDLKNINAFQSEYGQGQFDAINLRPLTGLESLRLNSMPGPEVIDLSHCKKLEELTLTDMPELREIRLPKQHSLWAVSLTGDSNLTPSTVDALINSVYKTAIKKQIWGFLHLNKYPHEEGNTEMVGPPSANSIRQLTELQNKYNWEILPVM